MMFYIIFIISSVWNLHITCVSAATCGRCATVGPTPAGCDGASLYSAPDDCNCVHWHCNQLAVQDRHGECPDGWKRYTNSGGITFCIQVFVAEVTREMAKANCDNHHNADLLNVRSLEKFSEGNTSLHTKMLKDLKTATKAFPHWCGLRLTQGKLYWDNMVPSPDRDLTSAKYFGYDRASASAVSFNPAQWTAFKSGRQCVSYHARLFSSRSHAILQPEYCSAHLPYACYKEIPADVETYYKPRNALLCGGEDGWMGTRDSGACYKYFNNLLPFVDAQRMCSSNRGNLANPRTLINQRYLTGVLSGLRNGSAPLMVHIGARGTNSSQVSFNTGGQLLASKLGEVSIMSTPTNTHQCAVFHNPYFIEKRPSSGAVQFDVCTTARPFICERKFSSRIVSDPALWSVTVVRGGYRLTCAVTGLDAVDGKIIWSKDHQYFSRQNLSSTISLTSNEYKYMIDDHSERIIGHGELEGLYVCEFWQTFPAKQYESVGLFVTFNDTTSLRMSTVVNDMSWNSELEGFNHRVSHHDELTPAVQRLHDMLLRKVRAALNPLSQQSVQYEVNIVSLRSTTDGKTEVDYRVTLSGEPVAIARRANTSNSTDNSNYLQSALNALSGSPLIDDNTKADNSSIEGQFLCLERKLIHPQTLEHLTLPLSINDAVVEVSGDCRGETRVMLRATCSYSRAARKSSWTSLFTNCSVACLAKTITHSVSGESFTLSNARVGQNLVLNGSCGRHEQVMFGADCAGGGWRVRELQCVLMCLPRQINHTQWSALLPIQETPVNTTFTFHMPCDSANKTILTARCELNSDKSDGVWTAVSKQNCEVSCKKELVVHPIGKTWDLSSSPLGRTVGLAGLCANRTSDLGSAVCEGDLAHGATWNVTFSPCNVRCPPQIFIHPHTKDPISLSFGEMNETVTQNLVCNDKPLPVRVRCQGTSSRGARWQIPVIPKCDPYCPEKNWYDPITDKTYTVTSAAFKNASLVKGSCGGREQLLMTATCAGNIVAGVVWQFRHSNCTPSCDAKVVTHPDAMTNLTFAAGHLYNDTVTLYGKCNGKDDTALAKAKCGGDITTLAEWVDLAFVTCVGYCRPVSVPYEDVERQPYSLRTGRVGEKISVNGTCALLPFTEIKATCVGNARDGGKWEYTVHSCSVDATCPVKYFVHPDTKDKLAVAQADPGVIAQVPGNCHGENVTMLNVTCQAVTGGRGEWTGEMYAECQTDISDQLTNLLENFKGDPLKLTTMTAKMSEDLSNTTDEVIERLVDIVEFVADPKTPKSVEKEGGFFFDIISNMMDVNLNTNKAKTELDSINKTESSGSRLAKSIERFLGSAKLNSPEVTATKANLVVKVVDTSSLGKDESPGMIQGQLEVSLPQSVTNGSKLSFVKYGSPVMFSSAKPILGNTVFSTSVADKVVKEHDGAITFVMKVSGNESLPERPICTYWNFTISDWSTDGCKLRARDNTSVTCTCNHLTNFAILMDTAGQENYIAEEHHLALTIISTAGLGVSIAALTLHLISFVVIVKLRRNQFQKVLACLALSILCSNIVFLVGIDKTDNEAGCIAVAALLHYFILCSFAWMFVEAFMQYRRFVKVLGTHITHVMVKAGLPALILPGVPVAIVMIIDPYLYRGGDRFCWMKPEALYYSFLLPIGCVIVANIVLFTLILRGLTCARPSQLRTNRSESEMRMMYFKAGLAIFTLLGLTWVFGFLAVSDARVVFQYLFCITNAFQGLIIFLLHNIRDPKVIAWWRRVLHLKPAKGTTTSATSTSYLSKKSDYSRTTSSADCEKEVYRPIPIKDKSSPMSDSIKSTTPLTTTSELSPTPPTYETEQKTEPPVNKCLQLEQSKLMHSSTESDSSSTSNATEGTATSDV